MIYCVKGLGEVQEHTNCMILSSIDLRISEVNSITAFIVECFGRNPY